MVNSEWRMSVTANGKIPKTARIKLPTFAKGSRLRHNGLVNRSAKEEATMLKVEDRFMIKDMYRKGMTISDMACVRGPLGTHVAIFHNVGDGEGPLQSFGAVPLFCCGKKH